MGNIRRKVAAVLLFIDTVRQRAISGSSLYIQAEPKSPIIRKEDGYVVIMEQPGVKNLDISISGGGFASMRIHIGVAGENPVHIHYVNLLPSSAYPFTEHMAIIHGKGASSEMYAVRMSDSSKYRLMEDIAAGGRAIRLWGAERLMPGQLMLLEGEGCREYITLLEPSDDTEYEYRVSGNIRNSYIKGKAKIYSAVRIMPDESGGFCIAYDGVRKGGEEILLEDKTIAIEEGQEYVINFD